MVPILKIDRNFKAVVADPNDTKLLECILTDILDEEVHIVKFISNELKITDLIVETNNGECLLIELNSNYDNSLKLRNLSYFTSYYSQIVVINLNYGMSEKEPFKEIYYLRGNITGRIYTDTFKIIDVNLDKYKEKWYDKCIEGDKKHIYLVMLNANSKEIKKLSKRDKIIREYEKKMLTLTKEGVVINHLTPKEEEEKLMRSRIHMAEIEGINKVAINLLKTNMSIEYIEKVTGLTKREIKILKEKIK